MLSDKSPPLNLTCINNHKNQEGKAQIAKAKIKITERGNHIRGRGGMNMNGCKKVMKEKERMSQSEN